MFRVDRYRRCFFSCVMKDLGLMERGKFWDRKIRAMGNGDYVEMGVFRFPFAKKNVCGKKNSVVGGTTRDQKKVPRIAVSTLQKRPIFITKNLLVFQGIFFAGFSKGAESQKMGSTIL